MDKARKKEYSNGILERSDMTEEQKLYAVSYVYKDELLQQCPPLFYAIIGWKDAHLKDMWSKEFVDCLEDIKSENEVPQSERKKIALSLFETNDEWKESAESEEWRMKVVPAFASVTGYVLVALSGDKAAIAKATLDFGENYVTLGDASDALVEFVKKNYEAHGYVVEDAVLTSKESYDAYNEKFHPDTDVFSFRENENGETDFFLNGNLVPQTNA